MYKKIDIFADKKYVFSTNQSRTCTEAIAKVEELIVQYPGNYRFLKGKKLTANFDKSHKFP